MNGIDVRFQGPYMLSLALAPFAVVTLVAYARFLKRAGFSGRLPVALRAATLAALMLYISGPVLYFAEKKPVKGSAAVLVDVSQSMRMEDGKGSPRISRAVKDSEKFLKEYGGEPSIYVFSDSSKRLVSINDLISEPAIGAKTNATDGIKNAASDSSSDVTDIVLFTDGNETGGYGSLDIPPGVKIHAVGYGLEKPGANCGVKEIIAPEYGFVKKQIGVSVEFYASGVPAGKNIGVELFEGSKRVGQAVVESAGPDLENYKIKLSYIPGTQGKKTLSAVVKTDLPEIEKADNARDVFVEIISDKKSALYVDAPGWDFRFLNEFLSGEKKIKVETILVGPGKTYFGREFRDRLGSASQLASYQLIIVGNAASDLSGGEKSALAAYLRGGGNMVVLGGANSLFAERGEWMSLLGSQQAVPSGDGDGFEVAPTKKGLESPLLGMSGGSAAWKKLPVLQTFHKVTVPQGADALAAHPWLKCGAGACPVIYSFAYGRGSALAFAAGGLWRWRLAERNQDYYDQMWAGVVSGMMESARRSPLEISIRRDVVGIGEKFEIAVSVNDEKLRRGPPPAVYAMTPDAGRETKLSPSAEVKGGANVFVCPASREGLYSFRATDGGASAGPVSGYAHVEPEEYKNVGLNTDFFAKIKSSGGIVGHDGDGSGIARELREKAEFEEVKKRHSPMNSGLALIVVALLLTLEWIARRRGGLT